MTGQRRRQKDTPTTMRGTDDDAYRDMWRRPWRRWRWPWRRWRRPWRRWRQQGWRRRRPMATRMTSSMTNNTAETCRRKHEPKVFWTCLQCCRRPARLPCALNALHWYCLVRPCIGIIDASLKHRSSSNVLHFAECILNFFFILSFRICSEADGGQNAHDQCHQDGSAASEHVW